MSDVKRVVGSSSLLGKTISRREAVKLGVAGSGALFVSMYAKPVIQNIGPARASNGSQPNGGNGRTGTEGCTPGYWQPANNKPWPSGYSVTDVWTDHFAAGVGIAAQLNTMNFAEILPPPEPTGCAKPFAMHAVAALLNAASGIDYKWSVQEVKDIVNAAVGEGTCAVLEPVKDSLETENERGCPL